MRELKDEQIEEAVQQRAAEWFVCHRERALSAQEQRQYMEWLQASPRHVEAYLSLIGLTTKLPEAIQGLDVDVDAISRQIRKSPGAAEKALFRQNSAGAQQRRRFRMQPAAWAASVLIALAPITYFAAEHWPLPQSIEAPTGQQRLVTLDDGSVAHLNADTRVAIRYSDTQRLIELTEGQALFSVRRDSRRPFIVRAGNTDVVAVGTRFDVYRGGAYTQVTVVEGKVEVVGSRSNGPATALGAGEQVRIADAGAISRPVAVDAVVATAWTRNEVAFAGERLEDVAEQFSRHTGARVVIEDEELREYRVSAVFQGYDLDSLVSYLEQFDGIDVQRAGEKVRVRGRLAQTMDKNR